MGKFLSILIVGSALIAGVALYYLQVYHFYEEVVPNGEDDVQLTARATDEPEAIRYEAFQAIDANS
ncbi:MAG: histidine kinase, partial [Pseudomonadota bacterium]